MNKALVDSSLKQLISSNQIKSYFDKDLFDFIQPASIDIPISNKAYLVKQKFIPFQHKISQIIDKFQIEEIDLDDGAILYKGQTYLIPCLNINLNNNLYGKISPKSSIGRIDLMVRAISDYVGLYDTIPKEFKGEVWLEVSPQSFNVKLSTGQTISQAMFFESSSSNLDLTSKDILFDNSGNKSPISYYNNNPDTIVLSLNVPIKDIFGYEAISTNEIIDISKISTYDPLHFFRKIENLSENKFTLEKDRFYILATKELISIPKSLSAEMLPFSHNIGELRAHYAGFFDSGFGNPKGASGVLEVRPHEDLTVYDGQPICLMQFFENNQDCDKVYGLANNNYQGQKGPKLSKYFI